MFIGHFGVGFGAKGVAPKVSLGTLFLAAQFLDLLWPTLLLLGIEQVRIKSTPSPGPPLVFTYYPFTHSLLAAIVWGALVGGIYYGLRRRRTAAVVVGLAVVSHWILDLIVHYPDLPLYPGGSLRVGFSLWSMPVVSNLVEFAILGAGLWLYLRTTQATDATGRWAVWGLVAFLAVIQIANTLGPPPPSVSTVAWAGQAQWLLVAWGYWVDRHRQAGGV